MEIFSKCWKMRPEFQDEVSPGDSESRVFGIEGRVQNRRGGGVCLRKSRTNQEPV